MSQLAVKSFFDPDTYTISYVVSDPETDRTAVIDSVLDFDQASGRTAVCARHRAVSRQVCKARACTGACGGPSVDNRGRRCNSR